MAVSTARGGRRGGHRHSSVLLVQWHPGSTVSGSRMMMISCLLVVVVIVIKSRAQPKLTQENAQEQGQKGTHTQHDTKESHAAAGA